MSKYLIWSIEHGAWWRPYGLGYTRNLMEAGIYTKEDAARHCNNANIVVDWISGIPKELAIRVEELPDSAKKFLKNTE